MLRIDQFRVEMGETLDKDQLLSELMADQLEIEGLDMRKLHSKLTTLRKKGGKLILPMFAVMT